MKQSIALALTWDGARWPVSSLPLKARAFLATRSRKIPSATKMATLLAADELKEIRICWVPRLKGGHDVLSGPFSTTSGKRLTYKATRTAQFGDILGVVYRRS
jgi:hypothetical protein